MFGYSLKQIAADISADEHKHEVVEKTVRRAVAKFQAQGLVTIDRHGPKASEYTLKSGHCVPKEWTNCPHRVDILATDSSTKEKRKETLKNPPLPPPGDREGIDYSFQPSAGNKGIPLVNPQETRKDTDLKDTGTRSTNGKSAPPRRIVQARQIQARRIVQARPL